MAWHERRVIVAGGTAGFGLVLARHLARAGARVLIVGRSSAGVRRALDTCDRAGESLDALHGAAAELGRAGEGNRIAGEALDRLGGVDDLFCCVGRSGRAQILGIHLKRRKLDPAKFDLKALVAASDGFSGAELEQAIVSALYEAHAQKASLNSAHVLGELSRARPISVVMAEKIADLRAWAAARAVSAD